MVIKCVSDGGTCALGGYCKECPYQEIAKLEQENQRLRGALEFYADHFEETSAIGEVAHKALEVSDE